MITIKIKTEDGMETWQAAEFEEGDLNHTIQEDGWYIRKDPEVLWSKEPFAAPEAQRKDVIQLLRKEKDIRY